MRVLVTGILLCLLTLGSVHAQDKPAPAKLRLAQQVYARELKKLKAERDAEIRKLTKQYIGVLEKVKVKYTKKGDLDSAVIVKKQIDDLKALLRASEG